jgi:hypothetical protein
MFKITALCLALAIINSAQSATIGGSLRGAYKTTTWQSLPMEVQNFFLNFIYNQASLDKTSGSYKFSGGLTIKSQIVNGENFMFIYTLNEYNSAGTMVGVNWAFVVGLLHVFDFFIFEGKRMQLNSLL